MDWVTLRSRGKELVRKYRYVLLVVLAGLFLMALPDGKNTKAAPEPAAAETEPRQDLQTGLEEILSQIQGAGGQGAGASDPAGRGADGIPDGRGFHILRHPVGHGFAQWL